MRWAVLMVILLTLSTAAAQTTQENASQTPQKDWLVMVYMDGDNNLEGAAIDDINEMEAGIQSAIDSEADKRIESARASGTEVTPEMEEQIRQQTKEDVTSKATVVVQVDRWDGKVPEGYPWYYAYADDKSNGDWTGTRRYVITPDSDAVNITSTKVQDFGEPEVNMGDPNSAKDFEAWAMKNYAANNTAVIYWNHGSGWKWNENEVTPSNASTKSVGSDWTNGSDSLTPLELEAVQSSLGKVDIMGFDACLMQMAEHAYQYQDKASIIIGSEEVEPGAGWSYEPVIAAAYSGASPEELAKTVVDSYSGPTLSAINTEKVSGVTNKLDALLNELSTAKKDEEVLKAYDNAKSGFGNNSKYGFGDSKNLEYGDLYIFADSVEKAGLSDNITAAARDLKGSIDEAVIAKHTEGNYSGTGGISIWMPSKIDKTSSNNYGALDIADNTRWDESVTHIVGQSGALQTTGDVVTYDSWW